MEGLRRMADHKDRSKLIDTIQHFRLIDDTYFNSFMDDNFTGMRLFLRIIMDDPKLEVLRIQTQREVSNIYGRSVRFDVFVKDADGAEYDVEVQRSDAWATRSLQQQHDGHHDRQKGLRMGKGSPAASTCHLHYGARHLERREANLPFLSDDCRAGSSASRRPCGHHLRQCRNPE